MKMETCVRFVGLVGVAVMLCAAAPAEPPVVRVRLDTTAGPITLAIDYRHAPRTAVNFLQYVDDGRLDGTSFYRASRKAGHPDLGFVQGGIGTDARRKLDMLPLEPTSQTGLRHISGAISMARYANPASGSANFSLLVGPAPNLDAKPGSPGYAVFGHVLSGMEVVKRMLAMPTAPGGDEDMKGQMLVRPITIVHAVRLDGTAKPTGRPKVWLMFKGL